MYKYIQLSEVVVIRKCGCTGHQAQEAKILEIFYRRGGDGTPHFLFSDIFCTFALYIKESTVDGWFKQTMELLRPLYEVLKSEVMKADYVHPKENPQRSL